MTELHPDIPNDAFPQQGHDDDLDWLAFCYVAGELDDADRAAFEQLLGESQTARERLAEAVAVVEGVAACAAAPGAASHEVATNVVGAARRCDLHRGPLLRPIAWLSLAAAVLVAAIWLGRRPGDDDTTATKTAVDEREVELAAAWASWLDESTDGSAGVVRGAVDEADNDDGNFPAASQPYESSAAVTFDEPLDAPLDAPDWMLAALGGEETGSDPAVDDSQGDYGDIDMDTDRDAPHDDGTQDG
jgi:hypothetical protein